ncbi:TPA: hypothetical protein DF272_06450 [Candidatus Falkowbacteria bacterium]|nr:hypothetical protein [Candidatus Falkowbacteria bacterium]
MSHKIILEIYAGQGEELPWLFAVDDIKNISEDAAGNTTIEHTGPYIMDDEFDPNNQRVNQSFTETPADLCLWLVANPDFVALRQYFNSPDYYVSRFLTVFERSKIENIIDLTGCCRFDYEGETVLVQVNYRDLVQVLNTKV